MATKNISITEEAYRRLTALRKKNESFSEIIIEVTGKRRLRELHSILSKGAGEALEKNIRSGRELHRKMHKERTKRFVEELNGLS